MLGRPRSSVRRHSTRGTALALAGAGALLGTPQVSAAVGDRLELSPFGADLNAPIGARLTLGSATACDVTMRYCFDFPLFSFGFDVTRPSSPRGGSISLAFAQAPLAGLAALGAVTSRSPIVLRTAALAVAALSGGMFRWAPAGEGNVSRPDGDTTTLSFVLKNEIAVHPFVSPIYLRISPGTGVAVTGLRRSQNGMPWSSTCGAGGFASLAA
jgi:hypothetical protein